MPNPELSSIGNGIVAVLAQTAAIFQTRYADLIERCSRLEDQPGDDKLLMREFINIGMRITGGRMNLSLLRQVAEIEVGKIRGQTAPGLSKTKYILWE